MLIIPKNTDVFVTIDILHPQTKFSLKNTAIYVKGDTQSYKEYTYLDAIEADFDQTTGVYKIAQTIFDQDPHPELIAVITFTGETSAPKQAPAPKDVNSSATNSGAVVTASATGNSSDATEVPTSGIAKAAFDYFYNNWEFAVLADYNKDEALALSNLIEHGGYDGHGFHIMFNQFDDTNKEDATAFANNTRTFNFYHTNKNEYYAAALASKGAQPAVGQVSWKFVSDLADVTPETITATEINNLSKMGLISYITKANNSNQTDDKNASDMYINTIHGMDFVKSSVETNLQNTLNNAGKLSFDSTGLAAIKGSLESTMALAYNQGIIANDLTTGKPMYSTTVPDITQINVQDWINRNLKGVKFDYTPSSAINTIHVNGAVNELV